jgi:ribonuclease BN (tRNA processing enzyme)
MEAIFCGVGEAFDEHLSNTSILVVDGSQGRRGQVLLDCGFSAPGPFWCHALDPSALDAVWISHFHGDHFLGLPQLMLRLFEEGRRQPLTIVCQTGGGAKFKAAMQLAYPGFSEKLTYRLDVVEVTARQTIERAGLQWAFAPVEHSKPCLAVRLTAQDGASLFYSGDGRPSAASQQLARGVNLVIHEAFTFDPQVGEAFNGHGSVAGCIEFARLAGARTLALVHINRDQRRRYGAEIESLAAEIDDLQLLLPVPGQRMVIADAKRPQG